MPLMKTLTFNILCSHILGLERGECRDKLRNYCQALVGGMWSVPINVPFTSYNRSIRASKMAKKLVKDLIKEKKEKLKENKSSIHQDLIACLLSIRDQDDKNVVSEEEIVHNVMLLLIAGHDTTSVLLTFLVRLLASDPAVYETVVKGMPDYLSLFLPDLTLSNFCRELAAYYVIFL